MFSPKNDLHGSNLVKGNTPYPIFLPYLVQASIDAYRFFTGPERLRRLGADLRSDHRSSSDGDHGKWGLVPSSLGMVVVVVSQRSAKDDRYEDLPKFRELKKSNPTEFCVDWMYGGSNATFLPRRRPTVSRRSNGDQRRSMHVAEPGNIRDAREGPVRTGRCTRKFRSRFRCVRPSDALNQQPSRGRVAQPFWQSPS